MKKNNNFQFPISNFQSIRKLVDKFQILKYLNPKPYLSAEASAKVDTLNSNKAFTLVELLVVIAVISMITAFLFPNFMGVRQRARDATRKQDVTQLQKALELYKLDQSPQKYPTTGAFFSADCKKCFSVTGTPDNCATDENIYMRKVPCDPNSVTTPTPYIYAQVDDLSYTLTACLENPEDPDKDASLNGSCDNASYTVYEP